VCQAVFLEGGLSRDGRLRPPKLGLLDYMLRDYEPDTHRDIVFIPVGINYDRTLEDRSLLRKLAPETGKRSWWFVMRTTVAFIIRNLTQMVLQRWHRFGYACVNFGSPISAADYCRHHGVRFGQLPRPERFAAISTLSQTLMAAVAEVVPVLPLSLVSTIFLEDIRAEWDIPSIDQRFRQLSADLQARGAPVFEISHSTRTQLVADAVNHLHLRHMVAAVNGRYRAQIEEASLLAYYANAIAHWWPEKAID
ncbi:MAG: hypothetical protein WAU91_23230, partial [Desulfatitalea sp.]